jgi:hypothetical protein
VLDPGQVVAREALDLADRVRKDIARHRDVPRQEVRDSVAKGLVAGVQEDEQVGVAARAVRVRRVGAEEADLLQVGMFLQAGRPGPKLPQHLLLIGEEDLHRIFQAKGLPVRCS